MRLHLFSPMLLFVFLFRPSFIFFLLKCHLVFTVPCVLLKLNSSPPLQFLFLLFFSPPPWNIPLYFQESPLCLVLNLSKPPGILNQLWGSQGQRRFCCPHPQHPDGKYPALLMEQMPPGQDPRDSGQDPRATRLFISEPPETEGILVQQVHFFRIQHAHAHAHVYTKFSGESNLPVRLCMRCITVVAHKLCTQSTYVSVS